MAIAKETFEASDNFAVQLAMLQKDNLLRAVSRKRQTKRCVFKYQPQLIYLKSTYIENPITNEKLPFPIEMWNQQEPAFYDAHRRGSILDNK